MFIILRKRSIKRTLALAVLLIMAGMSLVHPFKAQAKESNLFYLYPAKENNPVSPGGLFWSEAAPSFGELSMGGWLELMPDKKLVVGVPNSYQVNSAMLGNNLGKWAVAKLGKRISSSSKTTGSKYPPRDVLVYEREIGPEFVKEKIRVEIVDHFKDNDNFEKYLDTVKKHVTELPMDEKPAPKTPAPDNPDTAQAAMLGNTLILGGLAMLARVAYTLATRMPPPF